MNFGPSYPTTSTSIHIPANRNQDVWVFTGWNGSDGAVMTVGTILTNTPAPYAAPGRSGMTIHEAELSRNAQWVMAASQRQSVTAANFGSVVYWQVGTPNVVGCSILPSLQSQAVISNTFGCDGHEATGYNAEINVRQQGAGSPCSPVTACGANDNILTPYSTCAAPGVGAGCTNSLIATGITGIVNTTPSPYFFMDSHQSWMNDNPSDSEPILISDGTMFSPTSGRAWNDEVDAMTAIPVGGTPGPLYRFTVNGASDAASKFFYSSPRGNVSQNGKWFMFTSDMEEYNTVNNAPGFGLGAMGGGSNTCVPWVNSGGNCRLDVFIVELK